jgi:DNA polymerase I-like protein with 3'-5' exonuclease and polymerase domains
LQEGESTLVKKAAVLATKKLQQFSIDYKFINIVHDEMIFMVDDDGKTCYTVKRIVEDSIKEAGELLKLHCPMKGDGHVGYNWLGIH